MLRAGAIYQELELLDITQTHAHLSTFTNFMLPDYSRIQFHHATLKVLRKPREGQEGHS